MRPKNMPPSPTASPCVFAGHSVLFGQERLHSRPHGGVYASTTAHQLRQTMRNQLDNLEEAGMNFDQVVSTNVYLDDLRTRARSTKSMCSISMASCRPEQRSRKSRPAKQTRQRKPLS